LTGGRRSRRPDATIDCPAPGLRATMIELEIWIKYWSPAHPIFIARMRDPRRGYHGVAKTGHSGFDHVCTAQSIRSKAPANHRKTRNRLVCSPRRPLLRRGRDDAGFVTALASRPRQGSRIGSRYCGGKRRGWTFEFGRRADGYRGWAARKEKIGTLFWQLPAGYAPVLAGVQNISGDRDDRLAIWSIDGAQK